MEQPRRFTLVVPPPRLARWPERLVEDGSVLEDERSMPWSGGGGGGKVGSRPGRTGAARCHPHPRLAAAVAGSGRRAPAYMAAEAR